MRRLTLIGLMVFAGAGAGCSSTTNPPGYGLGGSGGAAGTGGGGGGGAGGGNDAAVDAPIAELAPPAPTGLVALNSDFSTTSLSILSTAGALVHADCVDSATGSGGGLTKTISGNTALPSQPQRGGNIVIVDDGNTALTFVNPSACIVSRQIAVPGVKTNPHDVVILADDKAYVTRYDQNLAATDETLAGNDIAIINPTTGAQTGRIVLDTYASTATGATILARPDRAIIAGGKVVVSLNEASVDFKSFGEGKVVVIDPATDQVVSSVALTGLSNCEGLSYVEASKTLLVPCGGGPISQSGVAVVDLGTSPPTLTRAIPATAFDGRPLGPFWVLALAPTAGGTRAFAVTHDPNYTDPDALFAFDYVAGTATQFASANSYNLGQPAGAPGLLLVPISTPATAQIKLYDVGGAPQATTSFTSDPVTNLPPQVVAWY
jgi:hypothetical protein